jgi:hypothetical protein
MPFFWQKPSSEVPDFLTRLVSANDLNSVAVADSRRSEERMNLTVPVLIIPLDEQKPVLDRLFAAVTRDFSTAGLSVVLETPRGLDEAIIALPWENAAKFVRAKAEHLNPMGAGFYQLGFHLIAIVHPSDCPALGSIGFESAC